MQSTSKLRTPAAAYAAARSLAVSATVAQSVSTYLSACISGRCAGRVFSLPSRLDLLIASIKPDCFMPSRIAHFMAQYSIQSASVAAKASRSVSQKNACCICALNAFKFMVTPGPFFKS